MPRIADRATDVAVALLLGTGLACCTGLTLALVGAFRLLPVLAAGAAGVLAGVLDARGSAPMRHTLDGPVVFLLALALYAPGSDATLYGSDATVYLGTGVYLAHHGTLRIDAPLLRALTPSTRDLLFPPFRAETPAVRERCAGGLAFDATAADASVYSTFAKLPSVWLAIGAAAGGIPGALLASPLLGAGAVMAYYLFLRRTVGVVAAVLATALLAGAVPQIAFARVSAAEIGGQYFFWGGLLALSRWLDTRRPAAALAAGLGFGCAALARIEFLAFLPLAAVLAWLRGVRLRVPWLTLVVAAALAIEAGVLLVALPSHYRGVFVAAVSQRATALVAFGGRHPWATLTPLVAVLLATMWAGARVAAAAPGRGLRTVRGVVCGAVVLWAVLVLVVTKVAPFSGARLLSYQASWLVIGLAVAGAPRLGRALWTDGAGRIAVLVGVVAAAHFLYDAHVQALPLWAGRRFLPVVLPMLFAAAAMALAGAIARDRRLGLPLAVAAVGLAALRGREIRTRPFLRGGSAAVAGIAGAVPDGDAVVLLDPAFKTALLDVPLWLTYGRESVQLRGAPGTVDALQVGDLVAQVRDRPVYLVRQAMSPLPEAAGVRVTPVAERASPVVDASDPRPRMLAVRVYRVGPP